MLIIPENVDGFQYRVVEKLANTQIGIKIWAKRPYVFPGKFNSPGRQLLVEVVNRKTYSIRDGVIFDWSVNYKPHSNS